MITNQLHRIVVLVVFLYLICVEHCFASNVELVKPNKEYGAKIYYERCSLCHGNHGRGRGILPLLMRGYPSTNLYANNDHSKTVDQLRTVIAHGANLQEIASLMPPWGNELSWNELESVVKFVVFQREDNEASYQMMLKAIETKPSLALGELVFRSRCALCHGYNGHGDGRLSTMLGKAKPTDLTKSLLANAELLSIVSNGGKSAGLSEMMPVWKEVLTPAEIESVVQYVLILRDK